MDQSGNSCRVSSAQSLCCCVTQHTCVAQRWCDKKLFFLSNWTWSFDWKAKPFQGRSWRNLIQSLSAFSISNVECLKYCLWKKMSRRKFCLPILCLSKNSFYYLNLKNRLLQLSFNGKQALQTDDIKTMSSLGFVSGDAVYILGAPAEKRFPKCPKIMENSTLQDFLMMEASANTSAAQKDPSHQTVHPMCIDSQDNPSHSRISKKMHPLLLEETTSHSPECFQELQVKNPGKINCTLEKLAGLLHILMVETGFHPERDPSTSLPDAYSTLPDSWSIKGGTLTLQYRSSLPPHPVCTIVITEIGPLAMVYGTGSGTKTRILKLKPTDYLSSEGVRNMKQLSKEFKDEIAFPLLVSLQREAGGVCPINLTNLPEEIYLEKILRFLDDRSLCRLGATCHQFHRLANDPGLWKRLFAQ